MEKRYNTWTKVVAGDRRPDSKHSVGFEKLYTASLVMTLANGAQIHNLRLPRLETTVNEVENR